MQTASRQRACWMPKEPKKWPAEKQARQESVWDKGKSFLGLAVAQASISTLGASEHVRGR